MTAVRFESGGFVTALQKAAGLFGRRGGPSASWQASAEGLRLLRCLLFKFLMRGAGLRGKEIRGRRESGVKPPHSKRRPGAAALRGRQARRG